jgi:periplasmic copper chaperone A
MLSLILQRIFAAVFMGLMMLSPAMASDLMFGALQFRATVGSMPSSAAYLSITNHGVMADRLLAVESGLARKTELHIMEVTNGVMKMRQIDGGIAIPAGKTIQLAPVGLHVMLIGLKEPLNADENYQVTLVFEKAGKVELTGLAKRPADLKMPSSHSSDTHSPEAHSPDAHSMNMPKSN